MKKILLVLLSIISVNVFAFPRGSDIYPSCYLLEDQIKYIKTESALLEFTKKSAYCFAAVSTAFDDVTTIWYASTTNYKTAACIDEYYAFGEFTSSQVLDMTVKYLREHPELRNQRIGIIVANMLHDKFPIPDVCKKLAA